MRGTRCYQLELLARKGLDERSVSRSVIEQRRPHVDEIWETLGAGEQPAQTVWAEEVLRCATQVSKDRLARSDLKGYYWVSSSVSPSGAPLVRVNSLRQPGPKSASRVS